MTDTLKAAVVAGSFFGLYYASIPCVAQTSEVETEYGFARKLYDDQLYGLAAEQFEVFAKRYPSHEKADQALFLAGSAYFADQQLEQAFNSFKDLELRYPTSALLPEARYKLAECRKLSDELAEAAELFKRIPLLHPKSDWARKALLEAGRAFRQKGDDQSAIDAFMRLIDDYPESSEQLDAHLEVIKIYVDRSDYQEALTRVEGVLRAHGTELHDPRVHFVQALILDKMGQPVAARAAYNKLIKRFPDSPQGSETHMRLARIYAAAKEFEAALSHYGKCLQEAKDRALRAEAHLGKGDLLREQGSLDLALQSYQQAASQATGHQKPIADLKVGQILLLLKQYEPAVSNFDKVIAALQEAKVEEQTLLDSAYVGLKDALIHSGRYQAALSKINAYLSEFKESLTYQQMLFAKARILADNLRDQTRALRVYDEILETSSHSPFVDEVQLKIAQCYESLGQYELASAEYGLYLDRFPAGDDYDWVRKRQRLIDDTLHPKSDNGLVEITRLIANYNQYQKDGILSLELAKLYFEAKDFRQAIQRFKKILANPRVERTKDEAYKLLGKSYLKLADYYSLHDRIQESQTYRDSAIVVFQFLAGKSQSEMAEDAHLALMKIALDTLSTANSSVEHLQTIKTRWLARFPDAKGLDHLLIQLGDHLLNEAAGDSVQVRLALQEFAALIENYPSSRYYEEARFKECVALRHLEVDSVAQAKLQTFMRDFPNSHFMPKALLIRADLALAVQNYSEASELLSTISANYYYAEIALQAKRRLAEIQSRTGDFESALDHYRDVLNFGQNGTSNGLPPGFTDTISFDIARLLAKLGRYSESLDHYLSFIHNHPNHEKSAEARLAVAQIAKNQNRTDFAVDYYRSILEYETRPDLEYEATASLADIFFEEKRYKEASTYYLSALRLASDPIQEEYATRQAIRCKYKLLQFAAADSDVEQFKRKYRDSKGALAQFLDDKGHAYIAAKNFKKAEESFKKLKDDFKDTEVGPRGEFGLAEIYLITNKTEEALEILTEIPSRYPDSEVTALTYFNLGDFYYKSQQIENAISAFRNVRAHPKGEDYDQTSLRYLIQCYEDLRLWDQAIALTREYLEKYPHAEDSFKKRIRLARYLKELKEFNRAIEKFSRLKPYADNEARAEIQFSIAECYQDMGSFKRAAAEFLKVKYTTNPTKLPWHVTALLKASDCFIRLGNFDQAKQILTSVVKERGAEDQFGKFARQKLAQLETDQKSESKRDGS